MSDSTSSGIAPDGTGFDLSGPEYAPCIALIHGLGLSRKIWQPMLADLSKEYRVLNYDLYGHGSSAPPPATASLAVFADQLANLMQHTGIEKAAVVGFSIGGMINRRFAMNYASRVSSLAILNSPHDRGEVAQQQVEDRAGKVREQGAMATMDAALKRWFTEDYLSDGSGVAAVKQWRSEVDAESYAQAAWVLANGVRELINPNPAIQCPALVMTCENDSGSSPKMSTDIAAEIDGARLTIIPRLKHLGLMQEPALFSDSILDFLSSVRGAS